ncbi:hypothetical protein [Acidianus sp. RZ1]|nr:hypothetical protein [Acidianus sp. RZ1]NON63346.1 hypothetical protein [Acidianus sp. RZ1]
MLDPLAIHAIEVGLSLNLGLLIQGLISGLLNLLAGVGGLLHGLLGIL